jgi:hypothetical protein
LSDWNVDQLRGGHTAWELALTRCFAIGNFPEHFGTLQRRYPVN